jgi:hypothetical protein
VQNDLTYLAILFALFNVSMLFIKACDRLIGSDEEALGRSAEDSRQPDPIVDREAA